MLTWIRNHRIYVTKWEVRTQNIQEDKHEDEAMKNKWTEEKKRENRQICKIIWRETIYMFRPINVLKVIWFNIIRYHNNTKLFKYHSSHFPSAKQLGKTLYIGHSINVSSQLYWKLQIDCKQLLVNFVSLCFKFCDLYIKMFRLFISPKWRN
jgi:hypothetical protein